jgi:hypothetical protein
MVPTRGVTTAGSPVPREEASEMARWEYFRLVPYLEGDTRYVIYDSKRYKCDGPV